MNRILWNERGEDIDEIVLSDAKVVHVEQMDKRCWWIGITLENGAYWAGNFNATSRGVMTFSEQESDVAWDRDDTHEQAKLNNNSYSDESAKSDQDFSQDHARYSENE